MSDYTVKSRRCSICGINYPPYVAVCRACGDDTWANSRATPDEDWTQLVEMHKKRIEDDAPPPLYPHRYDNQARIYRDSEGRLWVTHAELLENGYRFIDDTTILYLNEEFYETLAFIEKAGAWYIRHIQVDGAADNLEPAMFADGDTQEDQ